MNALERMQHLLAMAAADNRMNEAELGFLAERALELGISEVEFHNAMEAALAGNASLALPSSPAERRALIKDLLRMMAADGELQDREKELFANIASTMEIETDELHSIIDATLAEGS